ncbi:hypothetical protein [Marinomonas polaris]|uniref:hypothetical protein n=1 Tax=Marinomonas polaris TaxID=293552 RepID=UPI000934BB2C|nr:hypothetical protein [Marinomonas polaris]
MSSPPANASTKTKQSCVFPKDFAVDQTMVNWLNEKGITAPWQLETEKFANHHIAKGSLFKDWRAAWRTWMLNSIKYQVPAQQQHSPNGRQAVSDAINDIQNTDW